MMRAIEDVFETDVKKYGITKIEIMRKTIVKK